MRRGDTPVGRQARNVARTRRRLMRKKLLGGLVVGAVVMGLAVHMPSGAGEKRAKGVKPQLIAHNVYFALKDNSGAAKAKLVAACKKYLSGHPGEVFFAAGTL